MARKSSKKSEVQETVQASNVADTLVHPVVAIADVGEKMLEQIVAATLDETRGFIYTSAAIHAPLVKAGLVEINTEMKNTAGDFATRATDKGVQTVNAVVNTEETKSVVAAVAGFTLESGVPVPAGSGRGRSGHTTYPFEKMEIGQSFFVANSAERPNAAKSMASTVSSATARYAVETGETKKNKKGEDVPVMKETRKFIVRSVEENGVKGARVWRTA